jgi:hypothetical protein
MEWAVLMLAAVLGPLDRGLALQDRATYPPEAQRFIYYASTEHLPTPEERRDAAVGFTHALSQASPQDIAEYCQPYPLSPTLYRLDLRLLKISEATWRELVFKFPKKLAETPLVVDADWLTVQISDAQENPTAYYKIVFGDRIPPDRETALALLGVDPDPTRRIGLIAGQSSVAQQGVRWMEQRSLFRGSVWGTRDTLALVAHRDPFENLEGEFPHDGEEWIAHRWKTHIGTGFQGTLPVYLLFNGQGGSVNRAPVDLVRDHTEFRGLPEIRTPGSCIQCHRNGYNLPAENQVRTYIEAKVERHTANLDEAIKLKRFHLADTTKDFQRANEDYGKMVELITGVSAPEAASCFHDTVARYDEPVSLERAAAELFVDADRLRTQISLESAAGGSLTARIAGLAHDQPISREAFEEAWLALWTITQKWRPHATLSQPK